MLIAGAAAPEAAEISATTAAIRDFMIQNVCLDAAGAVLPGRNPLDGAARCPVQRDLLPGERLPYHKHDHPSPGATDAPLGYQRHDSFPARTAELGIVFEHSFDYGAGENRHFGIFDTGSDGGDIAVLSNDAVSIGATEDPTGGFGLWVGECQGPLTAAALARSWIIAEFDPSRPGPLQGETVAQLNGLPPDRQEACPSHFNAAYTRWRVAPFRYRAAPGQGDPVTLTTLISEHFGGPSAATADHLERFYFTRELGGTRWESWRNIAGNRQLSVDKIAEMAAAFARTGRCSTTEPPAGGAPMVLADCREWTRIVPAADPTGDPPGFFLEAIRRRPGYPAFFAPPSANR